MQKRITAGVGRRLLVALLWAAYGVNGAWAQGITNFGVTVSGGGSVNLPSDVAIRDPARGNDAVFEDMHWRTRPFEGSYYYGYALGGFAKRAPEWGLELNFTHNKAYAKVEENGHVRGTWQNAPVDEDAPISDRVQEFRITNGVNTFGLDVIYRWLGVGRSGGFPDGRIQPYVGAGPAYFILYPFNKVNEVKNVRRNYQNSGWGYEARGGVRYGLTARLDLFAEAKFVSGTARVDVDDGGAARTDLRTWHSVGGLRLRF